MAVTAFYAALLAPLYLVLSYRIIMYRRDNRVEIGDANDKALLRLIRVHSNFAEYVPFALVLMALAESLALPRLALHVIGLLLLGGRATHAWALSQTPHHLGGRTIGMLATFAALALAAIGCLWLSLAALL